MEQKERMIKEAALAYPGQAEIDRWADQLLEKSETLSVRGAFSDYMPVTVSFGNGPNTLVNRYVCFTVSDERRPFWGYWQPAFNQPAPLLINLPGYGGSISLHPQIADLGYNILHISPLGYVTPQSVQKELAMEDGNWPVLPNTALGKPGNYEEWITDCLLAVRWAHTQSGVLPNRLSFFGTSQGGGTSLLLASVLGPGKVRCVCADLPFLTDFPASALEGDAYGLLKSAYEQTPHSLFWNRLGYVDTISHAHRLTMPVMLSAGRADNVCPKETIEHLFSLIPGTRQYTCLENQVHTHSRASMYLFSCWLKMYA